MKVKNWIHTAVTEDVLQQNGLVGIQASRGRNPAGFSVLPGRLLFHLGPERSCIPASLVQSIKSTTFSGPIKIEEEKAKTREPFPQYQRNQTTKKSDCERFLNSQLQSFCSFSWVKKLN